MATTTNDRRKPKQPRTAGARGAAKPRRVATKESSPRRAPAQPPAPVRAATAGPAAAAVPLATPEPRFAARVPAPAAPPPRPTVRRAIFLDVENTSRPQHLAHVIDHLAVDRRDCTTDLVAVANWKVVSHDSARLLAQRGAQLVHSAPSTGVRDWTDLRIAVSAGIWLATARPGDTIEVISDDRAFDAVGDVAASLGVRFRRLSHRRLSKDEGLEAEASEARAPAGTEAAARRRRRRGGRRRPPGHRPPSERPAAVTPATAAARGPSAEAAHGPRLPRGHAGARPAAEAHTAPHDEIVAIVRSLVEAAPSGSVTLDAVANALKARGFRRPPGSPRLVTRLRRITEIVVSPTGAITLAGRTRRGADAERGGAEGRVVEAVPVETVGIEPEVIDVEAVPAEPIEPASAGEEVVDVAAPVPSDAGRARRRRRRRRRGGRRPAGHAVPTA